jgi:hypothetical protein
MHPTTDNTGSLNVTFIYIYNAMSTNDKHHEEEKITVHRAIWCTDENLH